MLAGVAHNLCLALTPGVDFGDISHSGDILSQVAPAKMTQKTESLLRDIVRTLSGSTGMCFSTLARLM